MTLSGTNLFSSDGQVQAYVGGQAAPTSCSAETSCAVTVPTLSGAARSVPVTVTTESGTSNAVTFSYQ